MTGKGKGVACPMADNPMVISDVGNYRSIIASLSHRMDSNANMSGTGHKPDHQANVLFAGTVHDSSIVVTLPC